MNYEASKRSIKQSLLQRNSLLEAVTLIELGRYQVQAAVNHAREAEGIAAGLATEDALAPKPGRRLTSPEAKRGWARRCWLAATPWVRGRLTGRRWTSCARSRVAPRGSWSGSCRT